MVSQAAEQGNAWAQNQLGECYKYGKGVEQSDEKARLWYSLAAKCLSEKK
jgi:TPR repeat protein